jgi:hypothetical protein
MPSPMIPLEKSSLEILARRGRKTQIKETGHERKTIMNVARSSPGVAKKMSRQKIFALLRILFGLLWAFDAFWNMNENNRKPRCEG